MVTGKELASKLGWSASKVSRMEAAKTLPSAADIKALGKHLEVGQEKIDDLLGLLREADQRGWWKGYEGVLSPEVITFLGLEAEAVEHRAWSPQIVHGLLQTEDYAKEVILASSDISRLMHSGVQVRLDIRLKRQEEIFNRIHPPHMIVVVDESVLLRQFGSPSVMREQLEHVLALSTFDHISVRILPLRGSHPINTGEFIHLKFADLDDTVFLESLYGGRTIDDPRLVPDYGGAFEQVRSRALTEDDSRVLIQQKIMNWR